MENDRVLVGAIFITLKKKTMKQIALFLGLILAQWTVAQTFEPFSFTGALNANGWTTHSGVTPGQFQTITTPSNSGSSLAFAALQNSTGNRALFVSSNTEDVNKPLSNITGIGYYSFLLNVTNTTGLTSNAGTGDYFMGIGGGSGSTLTVLAARASIKRGVAPNTFVLGISNQSGGASNTTWNATEYPIGTTCFVVVKLDATTTPITASMWINPTPGTMQPAATITNNSGTNGLANFASIFLRQNTNTGNLELDEIRAGSTWYQVTPCNTPTNYYADMDGDGFGDPNAVVSSCLLLPGLVTNNLDCDDSLSSINPNTVWYMDMDMDGFGDINMTTTACLQPAGYVADSSDCNDNDSTATVILTYYQDFDGDGFGNAGAPLMNCGQPVGYVADSTDCNDSDQNTYPNAPEICDGIDNNCNNSTDEGLPVFLLYQDLDNDGYGSDISMEYCDSTVQGFSLVNGDCNDGNAQIHPGATEILNNGIDENCDGMDNYAQVNELLDWTVTLVPNPSEGMVQIALSHAGDFKISVTDLAGKVIFEGEHATTAMMLNTSSWESGTYLVTVDQNNVRKVLPLMVK